MPSPSNQGDRAKAYRLRKEAKKKRLANVDALWLAEYEEKREKNEKAKAQSFGASRASRKLTVDLEENAESVGTGSAAAAAAGAALAAKEEGRRLDSLTVESVNALKEACNVYRDVCLSLKERTETLEATHIAMLEATRDHFLARTQTEAALMQLEHSKEDPDPGNALLMEVLAKHLGVRLPGHGSAMPPRNGAPPKKH